MNCPLCAFEIRGQFLDRIESRKYENIPGYATFDPDEEDPPEIGYDKKRKFLCPNCLQVEGEVDFCYGFSENAECLNGAHKFCTYGGKERGARRFHDCKREEPQALEVIDLKNEDPVPRQDLETQAELQNSALHCPKGNDTGVTKDHASLMATCTRCEYNFGSICLKSYNYEHHHRPYQSCGKHYNTGKFSDYLLGPTLFLFLDIFIWPQAAVCQMFFPRGSKRGSDDWTGGIGMLFIYPIFAIVALGLSLLLFFCCPFLAGMRDYNMIQRRKKEMNGDA